MVWPFSKTIPDFDCLPNAIVDSYGVVLGASKDFYKHFRCTNGMKVRDVMQIRVINKRVFCLSFLHHQWEMIYESVGENYKIWMAGFMPDEPVVWNFLRLSMLFAEKDGSILAANEMFKSEFDEYADVSDISLTVAEFANGHTFEAMICGRRYKISSIECGHSWLLVFEPYSNAESISSMVASVVHDFRNWLMIMDGYADMSKTDSCYIDRQKSTIQKAHKMVTDLLDFVNDNGKRELINICEALPKMVESFKMLLNGIKLELESQLGMAYIRLSYVELEQILHNLIKNSKEAGCSQVKIYLQQKSFQNSWAINGCKMKSGAYVDIRIVDDGAGVASPEMLFYGTTKTTGNGIGLKSIRQMLVNVGGGIVFISEPGFGTGVRLYIPILQADGGQSEALPVKEFAHEQQKGKILLVEDNEDIKDMLKVALIKNGYEVFDFGTAEDALENMPSEFDLLITDANLPGQSGAYLATGMRAKNPNLKLIIISGMNKDTIIPLFPAGAIFLCKPISLYYLLQEVKILIATLG